MINALLETASLRLGELNSFSRLVPDTNMFIVMHVLKEAVVSSRIEGKRTNIEEALIDESDIDPEKRDDWIGAASLADAVFVPPSHVELPELLSDFEAFHPFLDGNGRIGRLLIALYLVSSGVLDKPLLYLSEFFERNRGLYYDNLTLVREKNDLTQWLRFFLTGVIEVATKYRDTLHTIIALKSAIEKERLMTIGKRSKQALDLFHGLFTKPLISVRDAQELTGLTPKAANDLVQAFVERHILIETTGFRRNRVFIFDEYMKLFDS